MNSKGSKPPFFQKLEPRDRHDQVLSRFVATGIQTLQERSDGIDYVRIYKYEQLAFALIQARLASIARNGWDAEELAAWNSWLLDRVFPLFQAPRASSLRRALRISTTTT